MEVHVVSKAVLVFVQLNSLYPAWKRYVYLVDSLHHANIIN